MIGWFLHPNVFVFVYSWRRKDGHNNTQYPLLPLWMQNFGICKKMLLVLPFVFTVRAGPDPPRPPRPNNWVSSGGAGPAARRDVGSQDWGERYPALWSLAASDSIVHLIASAKHSAHQPNLSISLRQKSLLETGEAFLVEPATMAGGGRRLISSKFSHRHLFTGRNFPKNKMWRFYQKLPTSKVEST